MAMKLAHWCTINMIIETEAESKEQMQKTLSSLEKKLQRLRTGRADHSLLDSIEVDYYGSITPKAR